MISNDVWYHAAVTYDGTTWNLVAFQPDGRDNVTVSCSPADKGVDNAQYAYAVVDGFVERARAAVPSLPGRGAADAEARRP